MTGSDAETQMSEAANRLTAECACHPEAALSAHNCHDAPSELHCGQGSSQAGLHYLHLPVVLREQFLSHRVLEGYDEIVAACCEVWNSLTSQRLRSL